MKPRGLQVVLWGLMTLMVQTTSNLSAFPSNSVQSAELFLKAGDFQTSERLLKSLIIQAATNKQSVEEAKAHKWLGNVLSRSGSARINEALAEFKHAIVLLEPQLLKGEKEAKTESGFTYFDLASTLRISAEIQLREQRLRGINPENYFTIIRDNVSPAEDAIRKAEDYYPPEYAADLDYARGELSLLMTRLQYTFLPKTDTAPGYENSMNQFRNAMKKERSRGTLSRNDVTISAAVRIAEIRREQASRGNQPAISRSMATESLKELAEVEQLFTDHIEISSHLRYTVAVCLLDEGGTSMQPEKAKEIENDLNKAADDLESMRGKMAAESGFEYIGSFFSLRTHIYEALCRLYATTRQPEKMIQAIERMKARAFRDILPGRSESDLDLFLLQKHLANEKAGLIEFFYGTDHAWALWVAPGVPVEIIELPLGGQSLVQEMQKVSREFARPRDRRAWMRIRSGTMWKSELDTMTEGFRAAHNLYEVLARPFEEKAKQSGLTRLYVVPHHLMNYLSFDSLITKLDEDNLLASKFRVQNGLPITYVPSASMVRELSSSLSKIQGKAWVFARSDFHSISPTFPADLDGTISEGKMVAEATSADMYSEANATEARLRTLVGPFRLIYFATHGVLNTIRPLESAILLAATDDKKNESDGRVTVTELFKDLRGKLAADLVVLSACHTNEGEPNPTSGDDLAALSRGFMTSGASSVLATQWEASDATFPVIMGYFLDSWARKKQPKDQALMFALQEFLRTNDFPVWRHPHFWAPVILLGDAQ